MKKYIVIATLALGLIYGCKKTTIDATDNTSAAVDSIEAGYADKDSKPANADDSGKLMESMNGMMDRMHNLEPTGNADHDLAAMMEEHHQGAVDMADILLESGTDAEMKKLAQKIKDEQENEIKELQKIQGQYKDAAKNYDPRGSSGLAKAMMEDMMAMMKMPDGANSSIDKEFAVVMAKHHQDGIKMGKTILQYAKDAKFKADTQKMIDSQQKDIQVMQQWLALHK